MLFRKQKPSEKRRLLNFVLSNCTWKGSELQAEFRQPLDMLVVATLPMKRKKVPELPPTTFLKIGSPGRTRTSDMVVNSHPLYQLSYRGIFLAGYSNQGSKLQVLRCICSIVFMQLLQRVSLLAPSLILPHHNSGLLASLQSSLCKLACRSVRGRTD